MKERFRKFRRNGVFYAHGHVTGKQQSLQTTDKREAGRSVRCITPLLPLRMGGTGQELRISGTLRPTSPWSQQRAVSRAYAKNADVKLPSLEEYENAHDQRKVVPVKFAVSA